MNQLINLFCRSVIDENQNVLSTESLPLIPSNSSTSRTPVIKSRVFFDDKSDLSALNDFMKSYTSDELTNPMRLSPKKWTNTLPFSIFKIRAGQG